MKIQFIVTGWHYNQKDTIKALYDLKEMNEDIDVFWSCHREPPNSISDYFDYEVFFNGGEECGAYDQAVDHLDLEDDIICFFLHDDLIIKDFGFIEICVNALEIGYNVVGNGRDYGDYFDPFKKTEIGITEELDGAYFKDYVKEENQHMFDKKIPIVKVRPSFICMTAGSVKEMGGFEPRIEAYDYPRKNEEGTYVYRGNKGMSSWGNEFPQLNNYKFNVAFGQDKITYLSDTYLDSEYIYECARGNVVSDHPITNVSNIMVKDVKTQTFYLKED